MDYKKSDQEIPLNICQLQTMPNAYDHRSWISIQRIPYTRPTSNRKQNVVKDLSSNIHVLQLVLRRNFNHHRKPILIKTFSGNLIMSVRVDVKNRLTRRRYQRSADKVSPQGRGSKRSEPNEIRAIWIIRRPALSEARVSRGATQTARATVLRRLMAE